MYGDGFAKRKLPYWVMIPWKLAGPRYLLLHAFISGSLKNEKKKKITALFACILGKTLGSVVSY